MNDKSNPLISVVMATFNESPEIIQKSIESILSQTYPYFELIIVDDSTKQETILQIQKLSTDNRIHFIHNENRLGFVPSLNRGLREAKGKYVARMDGDDISYPERFEHQVRFLEANPQYYILGGNTDIINSNGEKISYRKYPVGDLEVFLFSAYRCPLAHSTVMMRAELLDKGFLYDESLPASEDIDFWLRAYYQGYKITNLDETLLQFRISDDFSEKRSGRKEVVYTAQVRKKHCTWKKPVHSALSYTLSRIYLYMPATLLASLHDKQNRVKKYGGKHGHK